MDSISELEFKVQILARCLGSALGLGRPTRIEIHYSASHGSENPSPGDQNIDKQLSSAIESMSDSQDRAIAWAA
ncbi:MAG: hypothetical protein Q6L60_08325 [Thermostichus sp. HHBFW_bins_43]